MNKKSNTYSLNHMASAVFMIAALLWLTVSVAFIVPAQLKLNNNLSIATSEVCNGAEEDDTNPFGNTNEEKASGNGTSFSEEYLHDNHAADHFLSLVTRIHNSRNSGIYNAFHGEVHVPPPNAA